MFQSPLVEDPRGEPVRSAADLDSALFDLIRRVSGSDRSAAREILLSAVATIGARAASLWLAPSEASDDLPLLEVAVPETDDGTAITPPDFAALAERRHLPSRMAPAAPEGSPVQILDLGIWSVGEMVGSTRFERTGTAWRPHEIAFLTAVSDRLAVTWERKEVRRARDHLREGERKLDELEALTNLGSWEWDPSTNAITWSAEQLRIHGLPEDQRHRTFQEFTASVHPEDRERVIQECERLVATGEPFAFPYRIVRSDGTIREMHALGKLLPDPCSSGMRAVGTSQDVTERNRAERALRASEESYRAIFECASEGIWVHDVLTGEMVDVNAAGGELYGYTVEQMKEVGHDALLYPGSEYTKERIAEYMGQVLAGATPRFEWMGMHRDGSEVWGEVTLRRVVIGGEERIVASTRDIGERKKAERALQHANEELEVRVSERTAELAAANAALAAEVAEHERAREQLTRRTRELESVFAALPDLYLRLSSDGTILEHRAGHGVSRYGLPAELVGRRLGDVLPDEVADRFAEALRTAEAAGTLVCLEYELPWEGEVRSFEARLLYAGDGSVVTIARDITDRTLTEAALRRSEEHFRALIENGNDYIMIVNPEAEIVYVAPSSERLLGYRPEEMLGMTPSDLVHPEDVPNALGALAAIVERPGRVITVEYRVRHKNGGYRVFESVGRTLLPDSIAAGIVANGRDITERKNAEAEVIRQKAYFEEILDSIDAGIAVFDREGRYEYVSPQSIRDPEMRAWAIGRTITEYGEKRGLPAEVIEQRVRSIAEGVATGVPNHFEQEAAQPDGGSRHLLRRLIPIRDAAGEVVRLVGYSVDITERKAAEVALQAAKDEAERANRAKSEFLSRMSHELRTPLNGILGFAQVLDRNGLDADQQKYVGHILKGGRHLLRLINEVLELSRIEAGRMSLSLEPILLSGVLREGLDLVRPLAEQARVELELDQSDLKDLYLRADRQRLVQIVLNLLSNAIKYNRPGGRVKISAGASTHLEGVSVSVRVEDTGRGIPEDRLDQLFVPFARLGAEQTETEGTGLGLALSRRLAEAMGGGLGLERTGREGSVFRLDLRAATNPLDEVRSVDGDRSAANVDAYEPATILYIEDNLTNLSLVETFLEAKPAWTTISALTGRSGIELAREKLPDLILLDLHLPDLHGEEVYRELRGDPRTSRIPIVVISADATSAAIDRLREAGADAYLTKPIDLDEFMAAVENFLAASRKKR